MPSAAVGSPRAWLPVAMLAGLFVITYRALLLGSLDSRHGVEVWLFRPSSLPAGAILGVAGWLLWRRRDAFSSSARAIGASARGVGLLLFLAGVAVFAWAQATRTVGLYLPALSLHLLAFATATRGAAGGRAVLLPAAVLWVGQPIPAALLDESVWQLQLSTTRATGWLLDLLGQEFLTGGVIIRGPDQAFQVIDGCSGMNGIQILTLVALLVRELFRDAGARLWLVVAVAPLLGFALNVVRIAVIATGPEPNAMVAPDGDHTAQGMAVLLAGTALLYAFGLLLSRGSGSSPGTDRGAPERRNTADRSWLPVAAALAVLCGISWVGPRFVPKPPEVTPVAFPMAGATWLGEPAQSDRLFLSRIPDSIHQRYKRAGATRDTDPVVDLYLGFERPGLPTTTILLSSKLAHPGPEWDVLERRRAEAWQLGRDVEVALAAPGVGPERAVVYTWKLRDQGLWREALRDWLALDRSPFRRENRRGVVRLVSFAPHDGQLMLDHAKQRLDDFMLEFRAELVAL